MTCNSCSSVLGGPVVLLTPGSSSAIAYDLCFECILRATLGRTGTDISILPPFGPRGSMGQKLMRLEKGQQLKGRRTDNVDLVSWLTRPGRESEMKQYAEAAQARIADQQAARMAREAAVLREAFCKRFAGGFHKHEWPKFQRHGLTGGSKYVGQWQHGEPHGDGTMTWPSGDTYAGSFAHGQPEGFGTTTFHDGGKYVGQFECGLFHGGGERVWEDGMRYKGQWHRGKQKGHGVQEWPDGTRYEGEFEESDPRGAHASAMQVVVRRFLARKLVARMRAPKTTPDSLVALAARIVARGVHERPDDHLFSSQRIKRVCPPHVKAQLGTALLESVHGLSDKFKKIVPHIAWTDTAECFKFTSARQTAADLSMLAYFLLSAEKVREVQMQWNHLGADGAVHVASFLEANRTLVSVDLSWNGVRHSGAALLCRAFAKNETLRTLRLAGNELRERGAVPVSMWLRGRCNVTDLDLGFNELGVAGGGHIGEALKTNRSLTKLSLRGNELGPAGGELLADALMANDGCIKTLIVTDNHLGARQVGALARVCKGSTAQRLAMFGLPQSINLNPVKLVRGDYTFAKREEGGKDAGVRDNQETG